MTWKPIPNHEGYEVSDSGDVRSWLPRNGSGGLASSPRLLTILPFADRPYLRVSLRGKTRRVHQLVLEAFVGPCPAGHIVMHIDDDPTNNALSNLRYGTPQDNSDDMVNKGRSCKGESHYKALVDDALRATIIAAAKNKQYYGGGAEVADDLALPANTVRKVIATHNIRARKEGKPIVSFKDRRTRSLVLET